MAWERQPERRPGALYSWAACIANPNTGQCTPQFNLTTKDDRSGWDADDDSGQSWGCELADFSLRSLAGATGAAASRQFLHRNATHTWRQPVDDRLHRIRPAALEPAKRHSADCYGGGGVIGTTASTGQTVTFDNNGSQTGQIVTLAPNPTQYSGGQWPARYFLETALVGQQRPAA